MDAYRTIDSIAAALKIAKTRGKRCSLLIGAGCSKTAEIPLASEIVDQIRQDRPDLWRIAADKTYPKVMAELPPAYRRDLIGSYIDKAKVNWAHIGIALLMESGYVDRVLTTNFDLLVVKACAMIGQFPATYDFASSQLFNPEYISNKNAVFYLHGQYTGFVLINTREEFARHSEQLNPVFDEASGGRIWIVVGYSGENDPVFEQLAQKRVFENELYWVGYRDAEPAKHVREQLLTPGKYAYYVRGFDADDFFVTLAQKLKIFPPDLVERPFSYLHESLEALAPYRQPGSLSAEEVTATARRLIRAAIDQFETKAAELANLDQDAPLPPIEDVKYPEIVEMAAQNLLLKGLYERVIRFHRQYGDIASPQKYGDKASEELPKAFAWAYVMHGNECLDRAKREPAEGRRLIREAEAHYETALRIKEDRYDVLVSWGNALLDEAKVTAAGTEADQLFATAEGKYRQALAGNPRLHEALVNWGNALLDRAKTKGGDEAEQLYGQAEEKYRQALEGDHHLTGALVNWGNALRDHAKATTGDSDRANRLFEAAHGKYRSALTIRADLHAALYEWGNALSDQARTHSGAEAERLFDQAGEKYRQALERKPDMHEALVSWGDALLDWAKRKSSSDADQLIRQAEDKYRAAWENNRGLYDVLVRWGNALLDRAKAVTGADADALFETTVEKYRRALDGDPGSHEALVNWGNALLDWAKMKVKAGEDAGELFRQSGDKYEAALTIRADLHVALYGWGNALSDQARTQSGAEAERLFDQAGEKYRQALERKPDMDEALVSWANALLDEGTKSGDEAQRGRLFSQAQEKYRRALEHRRCLREAIAQWERLLVEWQQVREEDRRLLAQVKAECAPAS